MSRYNLYRNADGLAVGYGTRSTDNKTGSIVASGNGVTKIIVLRIDLKDCSTESDAEAGTKGGATGAENIYVADYWANAPIIPANSHIVSARYFVDVVGAGSSAVLNVGSFVIGSDGLLDADDADSFINSTDGALANVTPIGASVVGTGAAINEAGHTANSIVVPTATTDFSSGEVTVMVEFKPPHDDTIA